MENSAAETAPEAAEEEDTEESTRRALHAAIFGNDSDSDGDDKEGEEEGVVVDALLEFMGNGSEEEEVDEEEEEVDEEEEGEEEEDLLAEVGEVPVPARQFSSASTRLALQQQQGLAARRAHDGESAAATAPDAAGSLMSDLARLWERMCDAGPDATPLLGGDLELTGNDAEPPVRAHAPIIFSRCALLRRLGAHDGKVAVPTLTTADVAKLVRACYTGEEVFLSDGAEVEGAPASGAANVRRDIRTLCLPHFELVRLKLRGAEVPGCAEPHRRPHLSPTPPTPPAPPAPRSLLPSPRPPPPVASLRPTYFLSPRRPPRRWRCTRRCCSRARRTSALLLQRLGPRARLARGPLLSAHPASRAM